MIRCRDYGRLFPFAAWIAAAVALVANAVIAADRCNILLCISDDQSYAHTSANGDPVVNTPAFDRVAQEGIRFTHAFCDAPSCGPSRSALLTGQHIWRLEEAGNIHSTLPAKFATYPELLEKAGYAIGSMSKAWGPGRLEPGGRTKNPAGVRFQSFDEFLRQKDPNRPFCFWLGSNDPHRPYQAGSGIASGKDPDRVIVPSNLPDYPIVRSDILDYLVEIERFDRQVAAALALLDERGLRDNTLVVVTSDHGMPFPRAKASLYDAGARVPLAIRWPAGIKAPGRVFDGFVSLSDLAPTFLEAARLPSPAEMAAQSLMSVFASSETDSNGPSRERAFIAMERHDGCRQGGKGYPCRALRTKDYLYIRNFEPDRWPSGDPDATHCARAIPYGEIDESPTKTFMMKHQRDEKVSRLFELAFGMRPAEELYDLAADPGQLINVAGQKQTAGIQRKLRDELMQYLTETKDPRALGQPALWDFYPYYGATFTKGWAVEIRK